MGRTPPSNGKHSARAASVTAATPVSAMPAKRFECFAAHNMGGMWCSSGKSEIRISKSETIQQIRISNYQIDLYEVGVGVFRSGDLFCRRFLAVGAVQVEINAAQRTLAFGFAQ